MASVSENRKKLEKEIDSKRQDLEKYRKYINPKSYESISILSDRKYEKQKELDGCWWFQYLKQRQLNDAISQLKKRIGELETLEKKEREFEDLQEQLKDIIPTQVWGGYPETLDAKIVDNYTNKFKTLTNPFTSKVPCINIIMIGETGAGKSSCLNTFATAVSGSKEIKDIYRVSPGQGRERSATQRIHLEPIQIGNNGPHLPCNFYDIPGLDDVETIRKDEITKIINGELKIDVELKKDSKVNLAREHPTLADKVHCILYVIKANSSLSTRQSKILKLMKEIKDSKNSEDGVRQFVLVTAIDKLGVPNDDMKNAYKYRCVKKFCEKASEALDVDLLHVLPVSNYFEEVAPNDAKNAISLYNLWRVFNLGKEYIERHSETEGTTNDFRRLLIRKE